MQLHKIYQNFFIASISRVITAIIGLVIIGFLTRHLGQAGYGAYETILAYLFIFTVLADFGFHLVHVREISRHPEKEKFISGNIFTLRLIALILVLVIAALVSFSLPYSEEIKKGIGLATIFVLFSSLSQILAGIFQKYDNFYLVSFSDIVSRLIQLGLVIWAIHQNLGLTTFILILSLTSGIQFGIIFPLSRRLIKFPLTIDIGYAKKILKTSLPITASILFTAIYIRTDTLMLSLMKPQADVGIYRLAAKLLETLVFFPALLVELTMPSFSYLAFNIKDTFNQIFKKTFNILFILAVPTVVYLFILAEKIVVILAGSNFSASAVPLKILAFVVGLVFLNNLAGKVLIALELQKFGMWIYFWGLVINITSNLLVIPRYSYLGASATTLATEILVTVLMFSLLYKKTNLKSGVEKILKPVLAGLVMTLIIYQFKNYNILIPFFIGLGVYFPTLYLIGGFTRSDLEDLEMVSKPFS